MAFAVDEGALVRNVWPGMGAAAGIRAADWAEIGITALPSSLHDVHAVAFGATAHPERLTRELGAAWAVDGAYHKVHACCQYGHAAVEATRELLASMPDINPARDLRRIRIDTYWRARKLDNLNPATTLAAKFSIQHILATTTHSPTSKVCSRPRDSRSRYGSPPTRRRPHGVSSRAAPTSPSEDRCGS